LLAQAGLEEKAVIEALVPEGEFEDVKRRFEALAKKRRQAGERLDELLRASDDARAAIQEILFNQWPELTSRLHVVSRRLISEDADEIRRFLASQPELQVLLAARNAEQSQEAQIESLERESARLERWLRAAENVVYERALKGRPGQRRHLAALRACEAAIPLGRVRP
jgi:septal ring factor EnvC (AmiA/AmiB activator)